MKLRFAFWVVLIFAGHAVAQTNNLRLWYRQPAQKWTEALPVGNGRLGAMIFGGVIDERIQFNENTLWTGHPQDYANTNGWQQLPQIRQLLAEGKNAEAGQLAKAKFLGNPPRQEAYQPFGDLHLHFADSGEITNYRRELDLDSAIARVSYRIGDVTYKREVFASRPDNAIVMRLTADKPGQLNFSVRMDSPHTNFQTLNVFQLENKSLDPSKAANQLVMIGKVQDDGLLFASCVNVLAANGKTSTASREIDVTSADSATLYLVAATSFKNSQDISANPIECCAADMEALHKRKYPDVLAAHLADYQHLFRRMNLNLGAESPAMPTDERLQRAKTSGLANDPALAALYFQYGRYLLISSSRPGGQPANLQGLWNDQLDPPEGGKWMLSLNSEMSCWPAEVCNLSECHAPLLDMIGNLAASGAHTAREQYGCRGWVVHDSTDIWLGTAPTDSGAGVWSTGNAWLCQHLWEHYLFTGDKDFLFQVYPVMRQASAFFVDYLVKDQKTGWLVTSPSYSPAQGNLTMGPTMDNQLVRALLNHTIEAAKILDTNQEFCRKLAAVRDQLPPNQIGKHGQLQEWLEDVDKPNDSHPYMSPLWALYPGADITSADPKVLAAAKVLLQWRGDGSTGWSYAWRIPLWARMGDGDAAFRQLNNLFQYATLPNLFSGPLQIDADLGATAGIAEMLVQSQNNELQLLPALPKAWPSGGIRGIRARGGFEVDINWQDGKLANATIHSLNGNPILLRYGGTTKLVKPKKGRTFVWDGKT